MGASPVPSNPNVKHAAIPALLLASVFLSSCAMFDPAPRTATLTPAGAQRSGSSNPATALSPTIVRPRAGRTRGRATSSLPDPSPKPAIPLPALDCTPHPADGYTNGKPTPITLIEVDNDRLEAQTAYAFMAMAEAAAHEGIRLRINSGFRSMQSQERLYACYATCSCNQCRKAAKPGFSKHQSGLAVDVGLADPRVSPWLQANAGRFGFVDTVASEPWHWVYQGSPRAPDRCNAVR